jgi:hypothetical protein
MTDEHSDVRLTEVGVQAELQRQPHILLRLAENALTVAESLRDNYFKNTTKFVVALRKTAKAIADGKWSADPLLTIHEITDATWPSFHREVVTFVDGGVGHVELSSQVPILLRVGSYCVRCGERRISEREQFGYYPVILGDLEGGSKGRKDFVDIVRIVAELLGGLSALERTPDLGVLLFHGPLVYLVGNYAGHTPFTERDVDLFLSHYGSSPEAGRQVKQDFLTEARLDVYPQMVADSDRWFQRRLFEPLAFMAFLYRRLIRVARERTPVPIIAGVVERGELSDFSRNVLLERVFRHLRDTGREDYFNRMYGRKDLTSPTSLLDKLGYTDTLLLAMLLRPGEYSEPWQIQKYDGLRKADVYEPDEAGQVPVKFAPLKPGTGCPGFPQVRGCYLQVTETTEPVRVEVFQDLGEEHLVEATRRAYLYSRLLPGYGFPVGLDIADKFAHVPGWLTTAYSKLIRHHLGVSLQRGDISDADMRKILVQAIYMTNRDWLFRPRS